MRHLLHEGYDEMGNTWHPNGCGVAIDTQDGHLDLADVTWQRVAPCGCVSGLTVAAVADELVVNAEQARMQFMDSAAQVERDKERGFTYRPREHRAACDEHARQCPHEPTWGYERAPVPEGMTWAAVEALGSRPRYTHLVRTSAVEAAENRDYSVLDVKPLCGGRGAFHWHRSPFATMGKVECKKCIAAAAKMLARQ